MPRGIAHADQLAPGQRDQRIGAFELPQGVDQPVDHRRIVADGDQMDDGLGVRGRLEDAALADQPAADAVGVGQVAVVGDGEAAELEVGEQRLHVAQDGLAGRRVADVADGVAARQAADDGFGVEVVADMTEGAVVMEVLAVEGDDAGGFLAAVLQGVQAERGMGGGVSVGLAEDAEDPAFLFRMVVVLGGDAGGPGCRAGHWRLPSISRSISWRSPRLYPLSPPLVFGASGSLVSMSRKIRFGFKFFLDSVLNIPGRLGAGVGRILGNQRPQHIGAVLDQRHGAGRTHPVRLLVRRHDPRQSEIEDAHDHRAADDPEQEAERAVEEVQRAGLDHPGDAPRVTKDRTTRVTMKIRTPAARSAISSDRNELAGIGLDVGIFRRWWRRWRRPSREPTGPRGRSPGHRRAGPRSAERSRPRYRRH